MAETQNPFVSDPHFDEFSVPSFHDFVDGYRDEMLLSPVRSPKEYLSGTHLCHPCPHFLSPQTDVRSVSLVTLSLSGFIRLLRMLMRGIGPLLQVLRLKHVRFEGLVPLCCLRTLQSFRC